MSNTTVVQDESIIQKSSQNEKTPKGEINDSKNKEKVDAEEKLKKYKEKFKSLCPLVKNLRKKLDSSLKELAKDEVSTELLASLIKKKHDQFSSGSNNDGFMLKLPQIEEHHWNNLKEELKYSLGWDELADDYNEAFSEVVRFYGSLIDLLGKLVLLCADPPKLLEIKKKKLAEIELYRCAVDGILSKIPGTDSDMAELVNEVKSEIKSFFDISDIKSLLDSV